MAQTPDESAVGAYISSLRYAASTTERYSQSARELLAWIGRNGLTFRNLSPDDIVRFTDYLRRERKNNPNTIAMKLRAASNLYGWLISAGLADTSPVKSVSLPWEGQWRVGLTVSEIKQLWDAAPSPRHQAVVGLLGIMAMRPDEVASFDIADLRAGTPYWSMNLDRRAGARSEVEALIPHQLVPVLREVAGKRRAGPLVTRRDGGRLTRHALAGLLITVSRNAGIGFEVKAMTLSYSLRAIALEHGFSYMGTIAAVGEPRATNGRRTPIPRAARPEEHAAIRLAHMMFDDPHSSHSMMFEAGIALSDTALPPAIAVMTAGAALERHLRELARARGVIFDKAEDKLQLNSYVSRLRQEGVISAADHGILLFVERRRNAAAHGWFEDVTKSDAAEVLQQCRTLVDRYPLVEGNI